MSAALSGSQIRSVSLAIADEKRRFRCAESHRRESQKTKARSNCFPVRSFIASEITGTLRWYISRSCLLTLLRHTACLNRFFDTENITRICEDSDIASSIRYTMRIGKAETESPHPNRPSIRLLLQSLVSLPNVKRFSSDIDNYLSQQP